MVYQIINGRGKNGYEQVTLGARLPFSREEKEQIAASFFTYKGNGSRITGGNLPECFYYYHTMTQEGCTAVVGKTAYVKALTSVLSGRRDTSISHKYIFTKGDEEGLVADGTLPFQVQSFCSVMEEKDALDEQIVFTPYLPEHAFADVLDHFGLTECLSQFLYAIVNSCYKKRSRTYIFGYSDTKEDSDFAKELMYYVMKGMPVCWRRAIGFVTYSPGIQEPNSNPLPHGVNVVFLGSKNRRNTLSEKEKQNYYFNMESFEHYHMPEQEPDEKSGMFFKELAEILENRNQKGSLSVFLAKNAVEFKPNDAGIPFVIAGYDFDLLLTRLRNGEDLTKDREAAEEIFLRFLSYSTSFSGYMRSVSIYFLHNYLRAYLEGEEGLTQKEWELMQTCMEKAKFLRKEITDVLARRFIKNTEAAKREQNELFEDTRWSILKEEMVSCLYEENRWNEYAATCFEMELKKQEQTESMTLHQRLEHLIRELRRLYVKNKTFAASSFMTNAVDRLLDSFFTDQEKAGCEELHYLYEELLQIEKTFGLRNLYRDIRQKYIAGRIPSESQLEELREEELDSLSVFTRNELCDLCKDDGRALYLKLLAKKIQKAVDKEPMEELIFHMEQLTRNDFSDIAPQIDFKQGEFLRASITMPESEKYSYYRYLLLTEYDVMALLKHVLYADSIRVIYHLLEMIQQMDEDSHLMLTESDRFYIHFTSECIRLACKRFQDKYHLAEREDPRL